MRADALMMLSRDGNPVDGESTDGMDQGLIEILSFALEIDTVEDEARRELEVAREFVEHLPLRVVRPVDVVSPKFQDYLNKGHNDLEVNIIVLQRSGVSTGNSDDWERKELLTIDLSHAQIVSVRVVADPRVHYLEQQSFYATESLQMGPLEEILISYGSIEYSYGTTGNKMTWTHQKYVDD